MIDIKRSSYKNLLEVLIDNKLIFSGHVSKLCKKFGPKFGPKLGPKTWDLVPLDIRDGATEQIFRQKIKKWIPDRCQCKLCKNTFINQVLSINNIAT